MKNVYVVNSCDQWQEWSSMRALGAFTNFKKMQKAIRSLIKNKTFELESEKFNKEWDVSDINNHVKYCYIEEMELNILER